MILDRPNRSAPRPSAGLLILPFLLLLLFLGAAGAAMAAEMDFSHWLENHDGYEQAMLKHRAEARPIVVYFRTDWCPYCRQFEDALLEVPEVVEAMKKMVLVRVNPEAGDTEMKLAARYRVDGYPAMFVHSTKSKAVVPVERTRVLRGRRVMKTPLEFIATLEAASEYDQGPNRR
jgi:thiol:disulfide interchange protein